MADDDTKREGPSREYREFMEAHERCVAAHERLKDALAITPPKVKVR